MLILRPPELVVVEKEPEQLLKSYVVYHCFTAIVGHTFTQLKL